jgi:hypothetical protein
MGRLQQVSGAFALAISTAFYGGCVGLQPNAKSAAPEKQPVAADVKVDPAVQQASAKVPAQTASASLAALAKAGSKELPKGSAVEIAVAWQNKVAQLPDPTRNGMMIHGVVGQMFLFGADFQFAPATGNLVVEMFDQSANPGTDGPRLGSWTFDKESLKKLVTMDERLGKCYALFLPWPEYDPNVSRVKLTVRFEPERSYPLYAPASTLTFDNGSHGPPIHNRSVVTNPGGVLPPGTTTTAGFSGLPPTPPATPRLVPPLEPLPVGGRNAPSAGNPLPPNMPSLVITPNR